MIGRIVDFSIGINRKQRVTIELDGDFRDQYDALHNETLSIEIKKHRQKRSLSANAYFHALINKIASETGEGEEEAKKRLVLEYGTLARNEDGTVLGFMLPDGADVFSIYKYVKPFDQRTIRGKRFTCYLVYKPTHTLNSKEMARLIDGAISEAKELGIETDTPEQLALYKTKWERM